jgi:carotenoid cleavage dioxygenase-like enzyme
MTQDLLSATPWTHEHPYLNGSFAPVHTELAADELTVRGELPRDLSGVYVRNSSNPRFPPRGRYHWFDGDGMLHAVAIDDGKARYRSRWIRTRAFAAESEAGATLWSGVTERPDFTNPRGPFKDSANTDIVYHAGRLLALWWLGGQPYVVRLPELETCGTAQLGAMKTVSAHPKVDMVTGEMMVFDYKPMPPYLTYGVVSPDGELRHHTVIDLDGPRLQHDMAITEHYSLVFDMSLMWDPALLKLGQTKVRFFRDRPSRIGVLPRYGQGSEVRWFSCAPFYMYHTINAWEDGDTIVLVGCRIEHPLAGDPENPAAEQVPTIGFLRLAPRLHRWTLDLKTGSVREEQLDDDFAEFPRMDNRRLGRPSRYSYSGHIGSIPLMRFDGLVKHDTTTGQRTTYTFPDGCYGGEPTFAPRAGSTDEDDGYVLTFLEDDRSGESSLGIFDARRIEAGPVGAILMPRRVPTGYHTWWVPQEGLEQQRV